MPRIVALGDSLTEGVGDPHPQWPNGVRGWADLVAATLSASDPNTDYANLALRGKTARDVADQQLPAALALDPDIVTIWAGGNDILRPVVRFDDVLAPLDRVLTQLAPRCRVVVFTGFEISGSPVFGPVGARVRTLNLALREMARDHGALVADVSARQAWTDRQWWAPDRVHPSPLGHRRIAAQVAGLLGFADATGRGPQQWPQPSPPTPRAMALAHEVQWWRQHAVPHIARWATGASRRERVLPKWSVPVRPAATHPWTSEGAQQSGRTS